MPLSRRAERVVSRIAVVLVSLASSLATPVLADAHQDPCEGSSRACVDIRRAALAAARRDDDVRGYHGVAARTPLYEAWTQQRFRLQAGDVILLRGDDLLASAISQIGIHPAFFSHMAIVGLDPQWESLEIVEAGVDEGLRTLAVDEWLDREFVRVAVYRHRDEHIARRAAIAAYADASARRGDARAYDLRLDLDDHARLYCSEVITLAYATAAPEAPRVPTQLSEIGALIDTFPLAELNVPSSALFLPDDLEFDDRFWRVTELRVSTALARANATDASLRRVFDALRGKERDEMLSLLDTQASGMSLRTLPLLLRNAYAAYRQLPRQARARLAALAHLVKTDVDGSS